VSWFGRFKQVVEMMIAALALTLGNPTVVTKETGLAAIPGLTFENWTALDTQA
jgi:tRNA(fMet)-specific endonuclease VapC